MSLFQKVGLPRAWASELLRPAGRGKRVGWRKRRWIGPGQGGWIGTTARTGPDCVLAWIENKKSLSHFGMAEGLVGDSGIGIGIGIGSVQGCCWC